MNLRLALNKSAFEIYHLTEQLDGHVCMKMRAATAAAAFGIDHDPYPDVSLAAAYAAFLVAKRAEDPVAALNIIFEIAAEYVSADEIGEVRGSA